MSNLSTCMKCVNIVTFLKSQKCQSGWKECKCYLASSYTSLILKIYQEVQTFSSLFLKRSSIFLHYESCSFVCLRTDEEIDLTFHNFHLAKIITAQFMFLTLLKCPHWCFCYIMNETIIFTKVTLQNAAGLLKCCCSPLLSVLCKLLSMHHSEASQRRGAETCSRSCAFTSECTDVTPNQQ